MESTRALVGDTSQRFYTDDFIQKVHHQVKSVLMLELEALTALTQSIPQNTYQLVEAILITTGRVIFSGTGKSGLIAKKLVATCSSLGIPSSFLHPLEALHGDLGVVLPGDLFIALSKSATGNELSIIIAALKKNSVTTALISCEAGTLSREVDISIVLPFDKEACSLNLAPTSSSTITMAFGDALAIAVSSIRKFSRSDFARFHPAGALGKQLQLEVEPLMYKNNQLPFIDENASFQDCIEIISEKKLGVGLVLNDHKRLMGIITDGDLRRACRIKGTSVFQSTAAAIMTKNPKTITSHELASAALQIMETFNITSLVVTDKNNYPVGILHIHEIIKAGIKN